ncbi:4-alpha-glucanotransferase [Bacteroidia bacterium]|nr:4-alpha-glucanotransferase [Bacteroidia bacterium]
MKTTVKTPFLKKNQVVILSGETALLGNWQPEKALPLQQLSPVEWTAEVSVKKSVECKFAIYDTASKTVVRWEDGENHRLDPDSIDWYIHFGWSDWKAAGVAIPVFSLRSKKSFGIGEFSDLRLMVDWAAECGMTVIQILPINDTTITRTWTDSYPYNAISIYALNPMYLGLSEFPLKDKAKLAAYKAKAETLNALAEIDYEQTLALKESYLHDLFGEAGESTLQSEEFKTFFAKNETWLFPYACFTHFRDRFKTADYNEWGELAVYNKEKLEEEIGKNEALKTAVHSAFFTQYLLDKQLVEVREYAHRNGVVLKGDIPIGVSRASVETWVEPHLFNLDAQTGAPPDDFSATGQNWGFPTYNWEEMAKDGYQWWQQRFRKMADYFDAYRIDHILGFFRIWEIPMEYKEGLMGCFSPALPFWEDEMRNDFGFYFHDSMINPKNYTEDVLFLRDKQDPYRFHPRIAAQQTDAYRDLWYDQKDAYNRLYNNFFYHRHNNFWREQALRKLPALVSSTNMLACGEDLGMIPDCVPAVMNELQILSLEIQRMPKDSRVRYINLNTIPYRSVCTTATHDMSPLRLWWRENRDNTQYYYNQMLWKGGAAPEDLTPELCRQIIYNHVHSPAMLAIIPLQDWLSMNGMLRRANPEEERINIPANPRHYWRYRMHLSLEDLNNEKGFINEIKAIIG